MRLILCFLFIISACASSPTREPAEVAETKTVPKAVSLTDCLKAKGVKMYGASWCGACQQQKAMFKKIGEDLSASDIYVECTEGPKCRTIPAYPTWEIGEDRLIGVQSLLRLREKTGC